MELKSKARKAAELGADVLLLNVFAYGLDVLQSLAEDDSAAFLAFDFSSIVLPVRLTAYSVLRPVSSKAASSTFFPSVIRFSKGALPV